AGVELAKGLARFGELLLRLLRAIEGRIRLLFKALHRGLDAVDLLQEGAVLALRALQTDLLLVMLESLLRLVDLALGGAPILRRGLGLRFDGGDLGRARRVLDVKLLHPVGNAGQPGLALREPAQRVLQLDDGLQRLRHGFAGLAKMNRGGAGAPPRMGSPRRANPRAEIIFIG